jgi:hypothetical protein
VVSVRHGPTFRATLSIKRMTDVLDRFRLDGRVAIVTGASAGLGVACQGFSWAVRDPAAATVD